MVLELFFGDPPEVSKMTKNTVLYKTRDFVDFVTFGGGTEMCQFVSFVSFCVHRKNVVLEGVFLLTE